MKKTMAFAAALSVLILLGLLSVRVSRDVPSERARGPASSQERNGAALSRAARPGKSAPRRGAETAGAAAAEERGADVQAGGSPAGDERRAEKSEEEADALVAAFDDLTDRWQEPSEKGVTMDEVSRFREQFRKLPASRRGECLQRALNLVPDENVMLLAGILLDKGLEPELIELAYNDILNRDEDVKKPILREIFKDKEHPCWADTAWILDVTGDLPGTAE